MDTAYLHLITNHVPVIGLPVAMAVLAYGIWRRSDEMKTAAFLLFSALGAATIVVWLLGRGGEDFVEDLAGVAHDTIHQHEDVANFALAAVLVTAAVSLYALLRYRGLSFLRRQARDWDVVDRGTAEAKTPVRYPHWAVFGVLLLSLVSSAILGYTAKLGGMIRHSEFYSGTQNAGDDRGVENGEGKETEEKGRGRNRGRN